MNRYRRINFLQWVTFIKLAMKLHRMSIKNDAVSVDQAARLLDESKSLFTEIFRHGSLVVEFYKPEKFDLQKPHDRDEVYVIATGTGVFDLNGKKWQFKPGDFLFVPAGAEHRFEGFSDDFATWVFFYGPVGGEK